MVKYKITLLIVDTMYFIFQENWGVEIAFITHFKYFQQFGFEDLKKITYMRVVQLKTY